MKLQKLAAILCAGMLAGTAQADPVADFYQGKTVTVYIGYSVGGGYDTYGRLVASHIGKHIPGEPTVVAQNMPGAGSLRLTNWLYEAAPQDGTAIGIIARAAPFEPLLGNEAASFDASRFHYIGNANAEFSLCAAMADTGIASVDDLRTTELLVGGTGAASDPVKQAKTANAMLGTQMTVIDGYPGGNDISLAMERGEVNGRCGWSWSTIKATQWDLVQSGDVNLLFAFASRSHPELPDVPLATELAETDEARQILAFISAPQDMGRPFVAPPGVPEERVAALRAAFAATMEDPEFLAAAEEASVELDWSSGEDLQEIVSNVYQTDPALIEELNQALQ